MKSASDGMAALPATPIAARPPADPEVPVAADPLVSVAELAASPATGPRLPGWVAPAASAAVGVLLLVLLAVAVHGELETLTLADVGAALRRVAAADIALAFLATAGSYAALIGYELLALRQLGRTDVPAAYAAVTGFIAYSFTFLLGFGVLTGGAVRMRRYRPKNFGPGETVAVTLVGAVSFWIGLAAIAGVCLVAEPEEVAMLGLPAPLGRAIGIAVLAALALWVAVNWIRPWTLTVAGFSLRMPRAQTALGVLALGILDTGFAALALWLLLPADAGTAFPAFLAVFALATIAGVVSHAPGGVGAFEAVILLSLPAVPKAELVASLLAFRIVYYAVPFGVGLVAFLAEEMRSGTLPFREQRRTLGRTLAPLMPRVAALIVFAGGLVLLVSGAVPREEIRYGALIDVLPLPFVETSHFVASGVGAALLIVGYGLIRRLTVSWRLAVGLLTAGAVFSLAKGLDWEEALVCVAILALLLATRKSFYRAGGAFTGAASPVWLGAVSIALALSVWVGLIAYRDVDYSDELWWQFAFESDAPRFLRATVIAAIVVVLAILWRALHAPARPELGPAPSQGAIAAALADATETSASLALLGDKRFVLSDTGPGFVMYQVQGGTWLAMGDPVANDPHTVVDLIWRFRELADRGAGTAAFYEVGAQNLPHYVDAGFSFVKLGEEAVVDLAQFSTAGSKNAKFRHAVSKGEREGLTFALVPKAEAGALLPELKAVSDAWIATQRGKEKGFSLGFWDPDYLAEFDIAVVRHEGRAIAFANILPTRDLETASVDLMRYLAETPNGTMDYLFVSLLLAMKAAGVKEFSLGVAPMAGMPTHALAPAWSRIGAMIFEHGSEFYNFKGLREFKAKFKPEWRPRYLAHAGRLSAARVLIDATILISQGPKLKTRDS